MTDVWIDLKKCSGSECGWCREFCPQVFGPKGELYPENCINCQVCQFNCPESAIQLIRGGWRTVKIESAGASLMNGNQAVVKAAISAGCKGYGGYPITPATLIGEVQTKELAKIPGGAAMQREDEIASLAFVIGLSIGGAKAMTATSGPGLSLMQEMISFAAEAEIPAVIVDIQRAGPSTGQATRVGGADFKAAIGGAHGGAEPIVLAPISPQDCFDLTVMAFNLSEMYRVPVIVLSDKSIAGAMEEVIIPEKIKIFERIYIPGEKRISGPATIAEYKAASMPCPGDIDKIKITGTTHYPDGARVSDPEAQQKMTDWLHYKIQSAIDFVPLEVIDLNHSTERIIITAGSIARGAEEAIKEAKRGIKTGLINIKMIAPFPYNQLTDIIRSSVGHSVQVAVIEMNQGQLVHQVREILPAESYTQNNGLPISSQRILKLLEKGEW